MLYFLTKTIFMEDIIRKIINTGFGAASLTLNKMRELVDDLMSQGKLSEEEGKKLMEDLRSETRKRGEIFESEMKKYIRMLLERMDLPSREEVTKLRNRVDLLEEKLQNKQ